MLKTFRSRHTFANRERALSALVIILENVVILLCRHADLPEVLELGTMMMAVAPQRDPSQAKASVSSLAWCGSLDRLEASAPLQWILEVLGPSVPQEKDELDLSS